MKLINEDNLIVLKKIRNEAIDLIYIDPPFNKKKEFIAKSGSIYDGAKFKDTFKEDDIKKEWLQDIKEYNNVLYSYLENIKKLSEIGSSKNNKNCLYNYYYLSYMAIRLIEMHRVLKDTGSIYLHCDPTMSHYLKITMDIIFGEDNFRNEIIWCYGGRGMSKKWFNKKHDVIFFYSKTNKYFFYDLEARRPIDEKAINRYNKVDKNGRKYAIIKNKNGTYSNIYLKKEGVVFEDYWQIPFERGNDYYGYPTQKPITLLERIIKASSKEGDVVLDAFCGSGTTCVVSEKLNRKAIGIDISQKAIDLTKKRLNLKK